MTANANRRRRAILGVVADAAPITRWGVESVA
jgi:hypothetical protein